MIGFWNLAADCHKYPQRMWPRIIAEHARLGLIDPSQDFFKGMSHKEVLRHTYVRLFATDSLPDPSWYPYAREVAPGIVELIALHRRRMSFWFRDEDVERFGGVDVLREAGLGNLRILPVEHRELMESPEGGRFLVLRGNSSYIQPDPHPGPACRCALPRCRHAARSPCRHPEPARSWGARHP
jgi:hypothetical protein